MEISSLLLTGLLIFVPVFISYKEKLNLEKEIIISTLLAAIQLIIAGFVLEYLFDYKNPIVSIILMLIIIINASRNAKKSKHVSYKIPFIALLLSTSFTMFVLLFTGALEFVPSEVVPVSGMIASNAMVALGIAYRNLDQAFTSSKEEIEVRLSLGSNKYMASKNIIISSLKNALMPTITSTKTLGIVSLPGMMTGMILADISPLIAIRFQLMVTVMLLSATSIACFIVVHLSYKHYFTNRIQLKD